jgi:hypothetical protein
MTYPPDPEPIDERARRRVIETRASAYVSPHLRWSELACRDAIHTTYPLSWRGDRAVRLAAVFEAIRALWNRPIAVRSAYRTPIYQRRLRELGYDAAPNSWHVQGLALDLAPPAGVTVAAFAARIRELAESEVADIGAIAAGGSFVHVDLRPRVGGRLASWTYGGSRPADRRTSPRKEPAP